MWKALRSGYGQAERSQAQRLKAAVTGHRIKVMLQCAKSKLPKAMLCAAVCCSIMPGQPFKMPRFVRGSFQKSPSALTEPWQAPAGLQDPVPLTGMTALRA